MTFTEGKKAKFLKVLPQANPLKGEVFVPADKSISHRAVLFNALAIGTAKVQNLLEGEDVISTITALKQCGIGIAKQQDGAYIIEGKGLNGLTKPLQQIYFGNSGTSTRLFMGIAAFCDFELSIAGDASLSKRPMLRVIEPLRKMGAEFFDKDAKTLPITMRGNNHLMPIDYTLPVASAQVKSAILLAGLNTRGVTTITEPQKTRDHTEIMLSNMGAKITSSGGNVNNTVSIEGLHQITAVDCLVPSDPSSAAFVIAAAILNEGSEVVVKNVCINPTRIGFIKTLQNMGADVNIVNQRLQSAESVGDIVARYSPNLKPANTDAADVPAMVDEFLILAVVCAFANGTSSLKSLHELTAKESNRFEAIITNLRLCGVDVEADYDNYNLSISGKGIDAKLKTPSEVVLTKLDHRIAMSFLVAGLKCSNGLTIDDAEAMNTSFPGFVDCLRGLGAGFE